MAVVKAKCKVFMKAMFACIVKGSPPEPREEVLELFQRLKLPKAEQLSMYQVFHELRQGEVDEVVKTAIHVEKKSIFLLVEERRKWVQDLLRVLLELGGCEEEDVYWDEFLYILVQFCSLSKTELCQTLFLIILHKVESKVSHYITMQQLISFYSFWGKCPVTSFNTRAIDFTRLPQRRYYVEDFVELVQRFTVLLNPIIHLQRSLQEFLPSADFWDDHHREEVTIRKITYDFYKMEKTRCFLFGEPPFRESCEMLAPEALGFEACNKDQWDLRTFDLHERIGAISENSLSKDGKFMAPPGFQYRSLKQFSVWGEQANPEETARMMLMDQEDVYITASGYISRHVKDMTQDDDADGKTKEEKKAERKKLKEKERAEWKARQEAEENGTYDETKKAKAKVHNAPEEINPLLDPTDSALRAACIDEVFNPPPADMPPKWMKGVAIAPAPRRLAPDPPLRVMEAADHTRSTFRESWSTMIGAGHTMESWGESNPGTAASMRKGKNEGALMRGGKSQMRGFNQVQFGDIYEDGR